MNEKDMSMKAYLSKPEIAADFFNVKFAGGAQVFRPEDLRLFQTEQILVSRRMQRHLRTLSFMDMAYSAEGVEYGGDVFDAFVDTEFQSTDDPIIVLRCMLYLVTYCIIWMKRLGVSHTGRMPIPMALLIYSGRRPLETDELFEEMVAFAPPIFKSFMMRFRLAVMDLRRVTPEEIKLFWTEAGSVVNCFPLQDDEAAFWEHLRYGMPRNLSVEGGYVINANFNCNVELPKNPEEMIVMCKAMRGIRRRFVNEGIAIGRNKGIVQGRNEGIVQGRNEGIVQGRNEGLQLGIERAKDALMRNALAIGYSQKEIKRLLDFGMK